MEYNLEDLDCNGNPYSDAIPLGEQASKVSGFNKPVHWPFMPVIGERIIIESVRGRYSEEVVKIDLANEWIHTTHEPHRHWTFCSRSWSPDNRFSRDTYQLGVMVRP